MTIRESDKKDMPEILALMKELINEHHRLDPYYKEFSRYRGLKSYILDSIKNVNWISLVAVEGEEIVGYFIGEIAEAPFYSSEKWVGVVADTAVKKELRRKGILKALFKEAMQRFQKQGVNYIELSVDTRNSAAVAAWKNLGFTDYKLRLRKKI